MRWKVNKKYVSYPENLRDCRMDAIKNRDERYGGPFGAMEAFSSEIDRIEFDNEV